MSVRTELEVRILASVIQADADVRGWYWDRIDADLISSPTWRPVYEAMSARFVAGRPPTSVRDLAATLGLAQSVRDTLALIPATWLVKKPTKPIFSGWLHRLADERGFERLVATQAAIVDVINARQLGKKFHFPAELAKIQQSLDLATRGAPSTSLLVDGPQDQDMLEIARKVRFPAKEKVLRIPSGLKSFDDHLGGGFSPGQLVLLAATTGSMKSTLATWMFAGMVTAGYSCGYSCMEMSAEEMSVNMQSAFLGEPAHAIINQTLQPTYHKQMLQRYDMLRQNLVNRYYIDFPGVGKTRNRVLGAFPGEALNVLFLDQMINIDITEFGFRGDSVHQGFRALSEKIKDWAQAHNCVVIATVQGDSEGELKRAKAMKDAADIVLTWSRKNKDKGKDNAEQLYSDGYLRVRVDKIRGPYADGFDIFLAGPRRFQGVCKFEQVEDPTNTFAAEGEGR